MAPRAQLVSTLLIFRVSWRRQREGQRGPCTRVEGWLGWEAGGSVLAPRAVRGTGHQEVSPYLQHFVSREAEFSEQQADVGEIHAQEGVALWAGLRRPAHWG